MKKEFTIFYTDDDLDDLDFFAEVVESMENGVELVTQNNGKKLLDALHNPPPSPSIVFLDLNMPGINGFDVLTEIRKSDNLKNIPVIILTTSNDDKNISKTTISDPHFLTIDDVVFTIIAQFSLCFS